MANTFEVSVDIDAPADTVWEIVGDPCGVPRWYPLYVGCELDGDVRVMRRADGAELVERLLERDDRRRFYSYSVLSGVPLTEHLSSFEVRERGGHCTVVWHTAGVPEDPEVDLEERLAGRQEEALQGLKAVAEGDG